MSKLNISISSEMDDKLFRSYMNSMQPFTLQVQPSGWHLYRLLLSAFQNRAVRIVETGCLRDTKMSAAFSDGWSTFYLARFAQRTKSSFFSIESESGNIEKCREFLHTYGMGNEVAFVNGKSPEDLMEADFYLLDSCDGLEHGLLEFKAALSFKPKVIVMDDLQTKAKSAIEFANETGIPNHQVDRYTVFDLRGK